jgi:hypothetical protein
MPKATTNATAPHRSPTNDLIAFLRHAPRRYAVMQPRRHFSCPLAGQMRDAFGVMEGLSTEDALRCLNRKEAARWV